MTVVVRTSIDPQSLTRSLERAVHEIDPGVPVYDVKALDQYLSAAVARPRLNTMLLATFGAFALVIGIVGIYGVISYSVAQRTREMGIRIALGAQKGDVLKLVVGHGSKLILTGVGFGIFGAFALTRFLSTMLFVVKPTDPVTFIAVSLILSGVALLASYLPARRATKVDPMVALRYE